MSVERRLFTVLVGGIGAVLSGIMPYSVHAEGMTEQQIAFAARLVQQESGGNQRDVRTGAVLVSSAGAKGLFQLMPGTAAHLGVNPDSAEGNVRGGLSEVIRLWAKYRGNQRLVAAAYNCGEGCLDDWLAGRRRTLPDETVRYMAAVASDRVSPPEPSVIPSIVPAASGNVFVKPSTGHELVFSSK